MTRPEHIETRIISGRPYFSYRGCAVAVIRTDLDGGPVIEHVETFYGDDGRRLRGAAMRYAAEVKRCGLSGWRDNILPRWAKRPDLPPVREGFPIIL